MGLGRDIGKIVGEFKRQCPHCRKLISREARICPYCQKEVTPIPREQLKKPTKKEDKIGTILAWIFGALILAWFAYMQIKCG